MIIDAHGHLWSSEEHKGWKEHNRSQIYALDKLNIDMCAISVLQKNNRCKPKKIY